MKESVLAVFVRSKCSILCIMIVKSHDVLNYHHTFLPRMFHFIFSIDTINILVSTILVTVLVNVMLVSTILVNIFVNTFMMELFFCWLPAIYIIIVYTITASYCIFTCITEYRLLYSLFTCITEYWYTAVGKIIR